MTHEQILDQQVEALEKLLQLKQAIITELESKVNKLEMEKITHPSGSIPWVGQQQHIIPYMWPADPCTANSNGYHNYPYGGGGGTGIALPSCIACGKQQTTGGNTTWQGAGGAGGTLQGGGAGNILLGGAGGGGISGTIMTGTGTILKGNTCTTIPGASPCDAGITYTSSPNLNDLASMATDLNGLLK